MYGKVLCISASAAQAFHAVFVYPFDIFVHDLVVRMDVVGEPDTILPQIKEVRAKVKSASGLDEMMPVNR